MTYASSCVNHASSPRSSASSIMKPASSSVNHASSSVNHASSRKSSASSRKSSASSRKSSASSWKSSANSKNSLQAIFRLSMRMKTPQTCLRTMSYTRSGRRSPVFIWQAFACFHLAGIRLFSFGIICQRTMGYSNLGGF